MVVEFHLTLKSKNDFEARYNLCFFTPLKESWETRRRLLAGGSVVEPTTRNHRNADRHKV